MARGRSFDQFANLVLEGAVERIIVGALYAETPLGLYVVRGENVVLLGEIDETRDPPPALQRARRPLVCGSVETASVTYLTLLSCTVQRCCMHVVAVVADVAGSCEAPLSLCCCVCFRYLKSSLQHQAVP